MILSPLAPLEHLGLEPLVLVDDEGTNGTNYNNLRHAALLPHLLFLVLGSSKQDAMCLCVLVGSECAHNYYQSSVSYSYGQFVSNWLFEQEVDFLLYRCFV